MKWLLIAAICLCLGVVMACEDIVIGETPINEIGNVVYVFPMESDHVGCRIDYGRVYELMVKRHYEDGYTVIFEQDISQSVNQVVITLPSGNVYTLHVVKERDYDDINYYSDFRWTGEDYN